METRRPKLLLADDSLTIQKVVTLTFTDEGMEVVSVGTGEEAIRVLEESGPPDVVLADVHMPGMSGYEVCERVKRDALWRHVPVVLLKGAFEPFNEAEARRVGADEVLSKPFQSIRDLIGKVGSLLGGKGGEEASHGDERQADTERHQGHTDAAREATTGAGVMQGADAARAPQAGTFATDFGMDDEMIEATPAESFGRRDEAARSGLAEVGAAFADDAMAEARAVERREETAYAAAGREGGADAHAGSPAFASRASAVATADDESLLDLGVADEPFSAPAETDDFVLDLDFDEPARASSVVTPAAYGRHESASRVDTASAFAEAAHGDGDTYGDAPAAAPAGYDFPAESAAREGVSATQDVSATRDFVEPQVIASDEPVRAGEDLSVEGDVVRPPAAATASAWDFSDAAVAHEEESAPAEARGESPESAVASAAAAITPGQLSPEMIDAVARRAVELMSERVVQEIAWEVVPALAERLIRQRLDEQK